MTPEGPRKTVSKLSLVSKIQGNIINTQSLSLDYINIKINIKIQILMMVIYQWLMN